MTDISVRCLSLREKKRDSYHNLRVGHVDPTCLDALGGMDNPESRRFFLGTYLSFCFGLLNALDLIIM